MPPGKRKNRREPSDDSESDASSVGSEPAPTQVNRAVRAGQAATRPPTVTALSSTAAAPPNASEQAASMPLLQPFLPTTDSRRSNRAHDTKFFFPHGEVVEKDVKVMKQICWVCQ
jgi:hypothetical protein